jgi:hypothetical protein
MNELGEIVNFNTVILLLLQAVWLASRRDPLDAPAPWAKYILE